jgi:putative copper export protein
VATGRCTRSPSRGPDILAADLVIRALHLIGAAVWAGGLVFLALAVAAARRTLADADRVAFFRALGRRFAIVGGVALLMLIATGSEMTSDRDAWGTLGEGTYGKTLLAKLILVGVVIVLTLVHSLIQGPALSRLRAQALERTDDEALQRRIRTKAAQAGVVSLLTLLATLAILVLAARLVTS